MGVWVFSTAVTMRMEPYEQDQDGLAVAAAAWVGGLASCDEAPPTEYHSPTPVISSPPARGAAAALPATAPVAQPMRKPPMLGPATPALVLVPERMAEPEIRVRLTDEQSQTPSIVA